VHFFNICVKNQQIHQLFIQFINYVLQLLHVSALLCHLHIVDGRVVSSPQLSNSQTALGTLPGDGNILPKHVGATIHN
jgi:hypothetical protein